MREINVLEYLPHRYPFVLVDKIVDFVEGKYIKGIKNLTINEEFFNGHFPNNPIMPGVLIIEALAQTSGILRFATVNEMVGRDDMFYLASVDNAKFKSIVRPGETLVLCSEIKKRKMDFWSFEAMAYVEESGQKKIVCIVNMVLARAKKKQNDDNISVDETSFIGKNVRISQNVTVGTHCFIDGDIEIGENTTIDSNVVIKGKTKIGKNNRIYQFASIGDIPQDKKYNGEDTYLEIGDNNTIREYCSIHRGTQQGIGYTKIGDRNLLMAYVHIAHDCIIGNDTVLSNYVALAGHVVVDDFVVMGGFSKVLQHCRLGRNCFIVASTDILKDVLPYVIVYGGVKSVKTCGLNTIGLRRNGFSDQTIKNLKQAYKIICKNVNGVTLKKILSELEDMSVYCQEILDMIDMLRNTKRGVIK